MVDKLPTPKQLPQVPEITPEIVATALAVLSDAFGKKPKPAPGSDNGTGYHDDPDFRLARFAQVHGLGDEHPPVHVDDPDFRLARFAEVYSHEPDKSSDSEPESPSVAHEDQLLRASIAESKTKLRRVAFEDHKNWSSMAIPLPESMKEPHRIGTLKPTYLVVLAGVEVGIFVSWLSYSSSQPPFNSAFSTWDTALAYYTKNFHDHNIQVIHDVGSILRPIDVPSAAPTPIKPVKRLKIVPRSLPPPRARACRPARARAEAPVAGPSNAATKVNKGRKRPHSALFDEDQDQDQDEDRAERLAPPPPYADKVINVSDFSTA